MTDINVNMAEVIKLLQQITELCRLLTDERLNCAELLIDEDGGWEVIVEYKYTHSLDNNFYQHYGYQNTLGDLVGILEGEVAGLTLRTQSHD